MLSVKFYVSLLFIFLFSFSNQFIYPQEQCVREQKRFGIYLQLFGGTDLGIHADYHVANSFDIDLGFGIMGSYQVGVRYFPFNESHEISLFPYIGANFVSIKEFRTFGNSAKEITKTKGFYLPVGLEWYLNKRFTLSLEVGYNRADDDLGQINTKVISGAFRIGYHF